MEEVSALQIGYFKVLSFLYPIHIHGSEQHGQVKIANAEAFQRKHGGVIFVKTWRECDRSQRRTGDTIFRMRLFPGKKRLDQYPGVREQN
jgi:hypothetical protein